MIFDSEDCNLDWGLLKIPTKQLGTQSKFASCN